MGEVGVEDELAFQGGQASGSGVDDLGDGLQRQAALFALLAQGGAGVAGPWAG